MILLIFICLGPVVSFIVPQLSSKKSQFSTSQFPLHIPSTLLQFYPKLELKNRCKSRVRSRSWQEMIKREDGKLQSGRIRNMQTRYNEIISIII